MELLNKIQQTLKAPKNQYNSFGKYKYRSCEDILMAVKPLLGDGTLTLSDSVIECGGRVFVVATAAITDKSEQITVEGCAEVPPDRKGMDASQITGCASSYARKYALNGLFCIDDTKDSDTNEDYKHQQSAPKSQPSQLPAMNKEEVAAMKSVFLIANENKPADMTPELFKREAANKLYQKMGHWPITQGEQEEAISILDKEYKK